MTLPPLALFRCDASPMIGAGHVTRCLALAEALVEAGWRAAFAVGGDTVATVPALAAGGFELYELKDDGSAEADRLGARFPDGVDLLAVDHYGRDVSFERACRPWACRILAMDDATGRSHDCDLLVDAAARNGEPYVGLVPAQARVLAGPAFALLRRAFVGKREEALLRRDDQPVGAILVSFGATDPFNATSMALAALDRLAGDFSITVALSSHASHVEEIRRRLRGRARLAIDADMAELIVQADVAIGAAGASAYERALLGLPSILVTLADNQRGSCRRLTESGAALDGGNLDDDLPSRLSKLVETLVADGGMRVRMAQNASSLVDGRGAARIAVAIAGEISVPDCGRVGLRFADAGDESWLLELQRAPQTRKYFKNPSSPSAEEHRAWMHRILHDDNATLAIIEMDGERAGMVRLDRKDGDADVGRYAISIAVSPGLQGRGIASAALALVRRLRPAAILGADIMPANTASQEVFLRAGFARVDGDRYRSLPA